MKYRLMTHTQTFLEDGQTVVRQLALDEDDRAYFFTAERVAALQGEEAPDDEVIRADAHLVRDPFAAPEEAELQEVDPPAPTFGPDPGASVIPPPAPGEEPGAEPDPK